MLRNIGGVVLGYLAMAVFIFLTFTIAFLAMGTERAFQPGNYTASGLWLGMAFVVSFIAASLGGLVCAKVAGNRRAPIALAAVILILGLLLAVAESRQDGGAAARSGEVGNFDAMQNARQPDWYNWIIPFVGVAGVVAGSRLRPGHI